MYSSVSKASLSSCIKQCNNLQTDCSGDFHIVPGSLKKILEKSEEMFHQCYKNSDVFTLVC